MVELEGRVALVTGASRGIGPYIARALASERMRVVLAARSKEGLDAAAAQLSAQGASVAVVPADLADPGAPEALAAAAAQPFGPIDVLVNNAGVMTPGAYDQAGRESIEHDVRVNLVAPMLLTRLLLPGMLERGRGHIVNVSSLAAKGGAYTEVYSTTKAGLVAFTASLRASYQGTGVSASAILPGFVSEVGITVEWTERTGVAPPRMAGASPPDRVAAAVVRAIRKDLPDVYVNPGPTRLVMALRELFPRLAERLVPRLGLDVAKRAAQAAGGDLQGPGGSPSSPPGSTR